MARPHGDETIRTPRLELVPLTARFVEAVVAADLAGAQVLIGARVGRWLVAGPGHLVHLHLAQLAAEPEGYTGIGRAIVLSVPGRARGVIGSIGFHAPPDDQGRMELGCRISPAHRGVGYSAEAVAALIGWATVRFGITRFLIAVPSEREVPNLVAVEMSIHGSDLTDESMDGLATLLEREPS